MMPANQPRDAIVIALDIGKSVSTVHEHEKETFFKQARDCVSWIIQRKIISQSNDILSLLLIGSEESNNPITTKGYQNIFVKFDFQLASWSMLKFIETEVKTTDTESDWFGALIVALEMLKVYQEFNDVSNKKIVLLSDFSKIVADDINTVVKTIKALKVEVTIMYEICDFTFNSLYLIPDSDFTTCCRISQEMFSRFVEIKNEIGPDYIHFTTNCDSGDDIDDYDDDDDEPEIKRKKSDKNLQCQEGVKVVFELWKKLQENIWICTFDSALKQLGSYVPKPKRVSYWNCLMDIGNVNINISIVKKTDPKSGKKFNIKCLKPNEEDPSKSSSNQDAMVKSEETAPTIRDTVMHYKHDAGQNSGFIDVEVKPGDTIEGFRYGTTLIPFSEEDKTAMEYKSGPKSFSVVGFTHISNVPYYLLSGECSYLVVPREKDKNAEVALSALIQGMKKTECLAIVRRVYSNDRGLALGIIHPTVEEIFSDDSDDVSYREYLLFVELAFSDDIKSISFPSLEKVSKNIAQEQYDAIDNLIDRMNLMKADRGFRGEPCEAFDLPFLHDFKEQFFHYCVIQRGLYPNKPLPTSLPSYISNFVKVPKTIEENCESVFVELKKRFKIKKSSNSKEAHWSGRKSSEYISRKGAGQSGKGVVHFTESFIKEDPNTSNRTWMKLFATGFPTNDALDKVLSTVEESSKSAVEQTLESFRIVLARVHAKYLKCNPWEYNLWMIGFKKYLDGKDGIESKIWEVIVTECFGLITKSENQYSNVSEDEAEEFLCTDLKKPGSAATEVPSFELLDELQAEQLDVDFDCS